LTDETHNENRCTGITQSGKPKDLITELGGDVSGQLKVTADIGSKDAIDNGIDTLIALLQRQIHKNVGHIHLINSLEETRQGRT